MTVAPFKSLFLFIQKQLKAAVFLHIIEPLAHRDIMRLVGTPTAGDKLRALMACCSNCLDGKEWSDIAFVPTKAIDGNSKTQLSYSYLDQKANFGLNYYRLMQTDVDGKYSYSVIRQVSIAQGEKVNIHPNPTTSLVNIGGLNGSELVVVYDLQGKKMLETKATSQQITLDFSSFASGVYTIQIVQNNTIVSEKVMKE